VQDLAEVAAVLGARETVQKRSLGVGDFHAALIDPDFLDAEKALRLDLD
jgi:hypothetical protein